MVAMPAFEDIAAASVPSHRRRQSTGAQSAVQSSLATLFTVSEDQVSSNRKMGDLFSLVDVVSIVAGCNKDDAGTRFRGEMQARAFSAQFPGRRWSNILRGVAQERAKEIVVRYHSGHDLSSQGDATRRRRHVTRRRRGSASLGSDRGSIVQHSQSSPPDVAEPRPGSRKRKRRG